MALPASVDDLKDQLRLSKSRNGQDGQLLTLIQAACGVVEGAIHHDISGATPTLNERGLMIAKQAILMLAAHWYDNRDGTADVPPAVMAIIAPLRRWGV